MKERNQLSAREVEQLHATLARRLGESSVPTLPQVAIKIIQLVTDPNAGMQDFARVIQTDQGLTGRLLRMANSAMYAQRTPVSRLDRAMILLGIDRLKAVALGFHLSQATLENEGDLSTRQVWTQSVFRAWLAFHLAERFDRNLTGEAFIVGLMLDAAIPLMPTILGEDYALRVPEGTAPHARFQLEFDGLMFTHVDLVLALAQVWRLPDVLSRPIGAHHTRPESVRLDSPSSILHAIAYFTGSLRLLPSELGSGSVSSEVDMELANKLFGTERQEMDRVLELAAGDYQASSAIFSHVLDPSTTVDQILRTVNQELNEHVEVLVEQSLWRERQTAPVRFELPGVILEVERASAGTVRVIIADGAGDRVFSEEINPAGRGQSELRSLLQHYDTSDEQIARVFKEISRLAA